MTIELTGLTKTYRGVAAVSDLTTTVVPGKVTAFLGPNGAGKTTTLRMILGLVRPSGGRALVDGLPYAELDFPRRIVGAVLGPDGFHRGRTGRDHLLVVARAAGIPRQRVDDVLASVDLAPQARCRVATYSLGMRQRLGLATAMLGDPAILIADEPANGLDPEGIAWLRGFLRRAADEGRTGPGVEPLPRQVTRTVDRVVVIDHGRLSSTAASRSSPDRRTARAPRPARTPDQRGHPDARMPPRWRTRSCG
jgi:ABC-2 type transport system ATP-binding protein